MLRFSSGEATGGERETVMAGDVLALVAATRRGRAALGGDEVLGVCVRALEFRERVVRGAMVKDDIKVHV